MPEFRDTNFCIKLNQFGGKLMQNQNMQQGMGMGQPLPQPPQVITVKDSLYLKDMLSWNLLAMKKAHYFANQCQDQEVKNLLNKAGQMHQKHYQIILNQLQGNIGNKQYMM